MKKFIIRVITYLFAFFFALAIFTYIFSIKNNMSFENSISYIHTIINNATKTPNNNSTNITQNADKDVEISAPITNTNNTYYYEQLDDTGKTIYTALRNNIDDLKTENYVIDFSDTFNDLLNQATGQYKLRKAFQSALDAFSHDHPELFYVDFGKFSLNTNIISIGPIKTYAVNISPQDNKNYLNSYFKSEYQVDTAINKVEKIKEDIIDTVSLENSTYNKIKEVHDILVNSLEYDTTVSKENIYNIYGAFVENKVVCEGYSKAFKYILDSLNIECILVSGTATNSSSETESHMWNYVKLDGSWYGVDVTWDDPIIIGGGSKNNLRHDYFLKRNNTFISSHEPSGKMSNTGMIFSLPVLSDTNYKW